MHLDERLQARGFSWQALPIGLHLKALKVDTYWHLHFQPGVPFWTILPYHSIKRVKCNLLPRFRFKSNMSGQFWKTHNNYKPPSFHWSAPKQNLFKLFSASIGPGSSGLTSTGSWWESWSRGRRRGGWRWPRWRRRPWRPWTPPRQTFCPYPPILEFNVHSQMTLLKKIHSLNLLWNALECQQ